MAVKEQWTDLGLLSEFPEGAPVLRKGDGQRFACVRRADHVDAIDDRCPHQGYPLSGGSVRDGVLTCEWHNWKFDLATGACTFGGEPVRSYPTRVEDGRVKLNFAVDTAAEARRLVAGLRAAQLEDDSGRALREALRLGKLGVGPGSEGLGVLHQAFEIVARDGAERAAYGFDHGLAVFADLAAWVERGWVPAEDAFVAGCHAIAEPSIHLGARAASTGDARSQRAVLARMADPEGEEPSKISEALFAERRFEAESRVRALVGERGPEGVLAALLPFASSHLWDYGHGAIFLSKALELARRFPGAAIEVLAASTVELGWATADTKLPPFTATRAAMSELAGAGRPSGRDVAFDRSTFEAAVLEGERSAVTAALALLREGCDPVALLRAVAHAAAVRLARFDRAWEERLDADVSVLDVTHAVTFAESAIVLSTGVSSDVSGRFVLLAAAFVGKLRHADETAPAAPSGAGRGDLLTHVRARELNGALASVAELTEGERLATYPALAPFAAFDAAVRPIRYAHTVKNTEALFRLEAGDPEADGAYLHALLSLVVPARREQHPRRVAEIARRFLADGRPPEGLY